MATSEPQSPLLRKISLFSPQRLRLPYDRSNPNWNPSKLTVWDSSDPTMVVPACSRDAKPRLWFEIDFRGLRDSLPPVAAGSRWYELKISYKFDDLPFDLEEKVSISQAGDYMSVEFPAWAFISDDPLDKVPYGFKGTVEYWLTLPDGKKYELGTTSLELYAVTYELPSVYQNGAINLELLRSIALPFTKKGLLTRYSFIEHVVKACFDSSNDPEIGEAAKDAIHNYRYNIMNGSARFANGSTYDLDAWAANKNRPNNHMVINCYDQAGLVYLALSLGIRAKYRTLEGEEIADERETDYDHEKCLQQIGILFKKPFGFINSTDLVGWGITDSPFFEETIKSSRAMGLEIRKDAKGRDLYRSEFRSHQWVYIRKKPDQGTPETPDELDNVNCLLCVDACAGPIGQQWLSVYLNRVIDSNANQKYPNQKYTESVRDPTKPDKEPMGSNYYNSTLKDRQLDYTPENYAALLKEFTFSSTIMQCDVKPTIKEHRKNTFKEADWIEHFLQSVWTRYTNALGTPAEEPVQANIPRLLEKLREVTQQLAEVPENKLDTYLTPLAVGAGSTLAQMDIWTDSGSPFVTVSIEVEQGLEAAVSRLLHTFHNADSDRGLWPVKEDDPTLCGTVHLARLEADKPNYGLAMFACGNIAVQISGSLSQAQANALVAAARPFFDSSVPRGLKSVPISAGDISWPRDLQPKYAVPFDLTIRAPDAAQVDVAFKQGFIVALQDVAETPGGSGTWTVSCVVQDTKATSDNIFVVVAEKTTYVESSVENLEILIN